MGLLNFWKAHKVKILGVEAYKIANCYPGIISRVAQEEVQEGGDTQPQNYPGL